MKIKEDYEIIVLKKEGDGSHVNQACDKFVALHGKSKSCEYLETLRGAKRLTKGVADQYGLVHTGLIFVAKTKAKIWTNSFVDCELDPQNRLSFPYWCKKIESVLVRGQTFTKE